MLTNTAGEGAAINSVSVCGRIARYRRQMGCKTASSQVARPQAQGTEATRVSHRPDRSPCQIFVISPWNFMNVAPTQTSPASTLPEMSAS
jgi:hypothetical protein